MIIHLGATISELQQSTGAVIKVNNSVPGVPERVIIIAGSPEAINLALGKVLLSLRENDSESSSADLTVRLLVPPAAAPAIIGRGGATIKDLQQNSGATIRIDNRQTPNTGRRLSLSEEDDRQVTVTGSLQKIESALMAILPHLSNFARFENDETLRETLTKATRQTTSAATVEYPPALYNQQCTIEFYVANEEAGAVIGRQGRRIRELGHRAQASVARHDEIDEDGRRKVTLSGSVQHVHKAHLEVLNWLREHREAASAAAARANGSQAAQGTNAGVNPNIPVVHNMMGVNGNHFRVSPMTGIPNGYTYAV